MDKRRGDLRKKQTVKQNFPTLKKRRLYNDSRTEILGEAAYEKKNMNIKYHDYEGLEENELKYRLGDMQPRRPFCKDRK